MQCRCCLQKALEAARLPPHPRSPAPPRPAAAWSPPAPGKEGRGRNGERGRSSVTYVPGRRWSPTAGERRAVDSASGGAPRRGRRRLKLVWALGRSLGRGGERGVPARRGGRGRGSGTGGPGSGRGRPVPGEASAAPCRSRRRSLGGGALLGAGGGAARSHPGGRWGRRGPSSRGAPETRGGGGCRTPGPGPHRAVAAAAAPSPPSGLHAPQAAARTSPASPAAAAAVPARPSSAPARGPRTEGGRRASAAAWGGEAGRRGPGSGAPHPPRHLRSPRATHRPRSRQAREQNKL